MASMVIRGVAMVGLEAEFPPEVDDRSLAVELGLHPDEVRRWSRGRRRHESPDGEGPAALAARAAGRLLTARGLGPSDIDFIVFATNTPDMFFPGSGCLLQSALGCRTVGGLDVRSQCTGFLAALDVGWRFVATGMFSRVLVAAAETNSHVQARDGRTPHLACATGDAGAALLLEPASGSDSSVPAVVLGSDGSRATDYWCEYPASRHAGEGTALTRRDRLPVDKVAAGRHFPEADLDRLRETALERLPATFREALARAGAESVAATLVVHVDARVEDELPARLGAQAGTVIAPDFLHAGGATLPALLARARADGRIREGDLVAMVTAGSGASWGSAVVRVP